ncbi:MAG: NAD(P)H-quinone oxidoreductase [Bradymonadaceae bacterium]
MKAIQIQNDESNTLIWSEVPTPQPGPGEVLVRVHSTACNRADLYQRKGGYPPPEGASDILGLEAAGKIAALGPDVDDWKEGDRVCALLAGGGYAEYVVVPAAMLLAIPEGMAFNEAAAIPEVFYTAYLNIFMEAAQKPGEIVLLHAGASGVGTAAIQLCRAFDSPVFATASAPKLQFLRDMGVQEAIDRENDDFSGIIARHTNKRGVDIILDPVGAAYLQKNIRSLATGGRLVLIGLLSGAETEISLGRILRKRLRIIGSVLRSRSLEEKVRITSEIRRKVWPLFETGRLKPIIDEVFAVDEANIAHDLLQTNATIGKVVLQVV